MTGKRLHYNLPTPKHLKPQRWRCGTCHRVNPGLTDDGKPTYCPHVPPWVIDDQKLYRECKLWRDDPHVR